MFTVLPTVLQNDSIHYLFMYQMNVAMRCMMPLSHDRIFASVRRRMGTRRIS